MPRQINILPKITNIRYDAVDKSCRITANICTNDRLKLERYNIRIAVATKNTCAKDLDFITQHYNEYVSLSMRDISFQKSVTTYRYNKYLKRGTETSAIYLHTSNPFSPFSTDMVAAEEIFNIGGIARNHSTPPDVAIFDGSLQGLVKKETVLQGQRYSLEYKMGQITIPHSSDEETLEQLSVYVFVYDIETARSLKSNTSLNLSLNTRMSYVGTATPLGKKYLFRETTITNPYPSSDTQNTLESPDRDLYSQKVQEISLDPIFKRMEKLLETSHVL